MKFALILVEGRTEEKFIKEILNPFMSAKGLLVTPVKIQTKEVQTGPNKKGGVVSYNKFKSEVNDLLKDSSVSAVSCIFDFYAFPKKIPNYLKIEGSDCFKEVENMQRAIYDDVGNCKFIPFLFLHEFEALLFVSPSDTSSISPSKKEKIRDELQKIKDKYNSPEEINQGRNTHPSRRIENLVPGYQKVFHGSLALKNVSLDLIRKECRHFDMWLKKLENI
jgi:hypothetical protein